MSYLDLNPTPTPIEAGGTYARSPSPERPPPPPHLGKGVYPLSRVLVTIANYKKHGVALFRAFSGNLPETLAKKFPISRENGKTLVQVLINFKRKSKHFQTEKWKFDVNRGGGGGEAMKFRIFAIFM